MADVGQSANLMLIQEVCEGVLGAAGCKCVLGYYDTQFWNEAQNRVATTLIQGNCSSNKSTRGDPHSRHCGSPPADSIHDDYTSLSVLVPAGTRRLCSFVMAGERDAASPQSAPSGAACAQDPVAGRRAPIRVVTPVTDSTGSCPASSP